MTVRERAQLGKQGAAASSGSPHWPVQMGEERLQEVMGRMDRGSGGGGEGLSLPEKLLALE